MVERKFCDICNGEINAEEYPPKKHQCWNTIVNSIIKERMDICNNCLEHFENDFHLFKLNLTRKINEIKKDTIVEGKHQNDK